MSDIDDAVAASLAAQKGEYIAEIMNQKTMVENDLKTQVSEINKQVTELEGFKKGLIPPIFKTQDANVKIRDQFLLENQLTMLYGGKSEEKPQLLPLILIVGAVWYFVFKKKGSYGIF